MIMNKCWTFTILLSLTMAASSQADDHLIITSDFDEHILNPEQLGPLRFNNWTDPNTNFSGTNYRIWLPNNTLNFWFGVGLGQNTGGFDVTLGTFNNIGVPFNSAAQWWHVVHLYIERNEVRQRNEGRPWQSPWWCGAKIVLSKGMFPLNNEVLGIDDYECYIVEQTNMTRADMESLFNLKNESSSTIDGVKYYHYRAQVGGLKQIWSIRQNGSNTSLIPVGLIGQEWRRKVPEIRNWNAQGWLLFYENQGEHDGDIVFENIWIP